MGLETVWKADGKKLEISWNGLENFRCLNGDGSNARSRGECQAGGTADVR